MPGYKFAVPGVREACAGGCRKGSPTNDLMDLIEVHESAIGRQSY